VVEKVGHLIENKITCIILAGGKSSRFKSDKSRLKIGSKTLTHYQYKKYSKFFKKVYISSKKDKWGLKNIVYDRYKLYAPIFALIKLIQKFNKVFIIPVDVPLLNQNSIKKLLKTKTITCNSPFIGVYSRKDLKFLKQNIKKGKFSPRFGKKCIEIDEKELINLNYKNEYNKYRFEVKKSLKTKSQKRL
jgi:molybdopterin-guanine dinucleotide biosynthesis protein A